jgi:uncharacterized membrane protein YkoI
MNKKTVIILGIIGSLAVGGGVIAKNSFGTKNQSVLADLQDKVTKEQARAIALERVKGEVVDEEYEKENGKMVYGFEIKQADGTVTEVKVDEMTGKIIFVGKDDADKEDNDGADGDDDDDSMHSANKSEMHEMKDNDDSEESEASLMKQAKITKADAEAIALKKAAGTVEDGELEMEHGKLVYSFDIRNKKGTITEVQVDAKTGKIVSVEEEDAAKEAAEKKQEMKEKKSKP